MKKFIRIFWFVLFLFAMVMFYVVPISVPDYVDKFYHFIGFAIFAILSIALFAVFFDNKWLNTFLVFLLIFGGVIAGVAELAQKHFSEIRSCDYGDWIANLYGIVFITLFVYLANSRQKLSIELFEEEFKIESFS